MVIKMDVQGERTLTTDMVEGQIKKLGNRCAYTIEKSRKKGGRTVELWLKHKRFDGRLRVRDSEKKNEIKTNASFGNEQNLTGRWIEWMIQYFWNSRLTFDVDATNVVWIR